MKSPIKLSIVVINWNTRVLLHHCLSSIKNNPPSCSFEILVIDNASDDESVIMLADEFPDARVIHNNQNIGFAAGNNQAIKKSNGNILLFLNPDTVVLGDAIDKLLCFIEENPNAGVVGPQLLNPDHTIQPSSQVFPSLLSTFVDATLLFRLKPLKGIGERFDLRYWSHDEIRSVDWITGACMLIRREVIKQVGGMDESYFMYSEETDWCFRIRKAGWDIVFYPEAKIIHIGGASASQRIDRMKSTWIRSYIFFYYKHYGVLQASIARFIMTCGYLWRLLIWGILYLTSRSKRRTAGQMIHQWSSSLEWCLFGKI